MFGKTCFQSGQAIIVDQERADTASLRQFSQARYQSSTSVRAGLAQLRSSAKQHAAKKNTITPQLVLNVLWPWCDQHLLAHFKCWNVRAKSDTGSNGLRDFLRCYGGRRAAGHTFEVGVQRRVNQPLVSEPCEHGVVVSCNFSLF